MKDFIAGLGAGEAYTSIHNAFFPGGSIRAFVTSIPEPVQGWSFAAAVGLRWRARSVGNGRRL
jgi:hypothetical protein